MGKLTAMQKMRAANKAATASARQDRVGDYNVTLDRLGAIFGNLSTTQKGFGRALAASNARQVEAMRRLSDRAVAGAGSDISKASRSARNLYGSALGGAIDQQLGAARAHGAGGAMGTQAAAIGGQMLAFGSKQAQQMIQTGAKEAASSAKYEAAQALLYRAKDDAQAQMQRQQSILDARLQFENWKKQQDYLAKHDPALNGGKGNAAGMMAVTNSATDGSALFRTLLVNDPTMTADELVAKYEADNGQLDQNEHTVLLAVARAVKGSIDPTTGLTKDGYTREDEAKAIVQALHLLYPNFSGHIDKIQKTIAAGLDSYYAAAKVNPNPDNDPRHNVSTAGLQPGDQVRGPMGDIGYVQADGSIKWLS